MEHIYRVAVTTEVVAMVSRLVVSEQIVRAGEYAAEAVGAADLAVVLVDRVCVDGVAPFSS